MYFSTKYLEEGRRNRDQNTTKFKAFTNQRRFPYPLKPVKANEQNRKPIVTLFLVFGVLRGDLVEDKSNAMIGLFIDKGLHCSENIRWTGDAV